MAEPMVNAAPLVVPISQPRAAAVPTPRPRPSLRAVIPPSVEAGAGAPVAPPTPAATEDVVVARSPARASLLDHIAPGLMEKAGDVAYAVSRTPEDAGPISAFATGWSGALAHRKEREAAAAAAAKKTADEDEADAWKQKEWDYKVSTDERDYALEREKLDSKGQGKYIDRNGGLTPDAHFKVYDLANKLRSDLVKSYGLSAATFGRDPKGREAAIAAIDAKVKQYRADVLEAISNGEDPDSVPKPDVKGDVSTQGDLPTDEAGTTYGKGAAKTKGNLPLPEKVKPVKGLGTAEEPYVVEGNAWPSLDVFNRSVKIGDFYVDENGVKSKRVR